MGRFVCSLLSCLCGYVVLNGPAARCCRRRCPASLTGDGLKCTLERCSPGFEANAEQTGCTYCPAGKVKPSFGIESCELCPDPVSERPNSDATRCECKPDYVNFGTYRKMQPAFSHVRMQKGLRARF